MNNLGRRITQSWPPANFRYRKTWSHKIRDWIDTTNTRLKPVWKILFPNFIVVHYTYIISITLLTSFLLYPVHNQPYIDILFISAGAATQGGLNSVSTNDYTLYQQIIVYLMCCLATPIFIHGSLAFIRLYWFERYFDNIKYTSRQDFLRRRTMTMQNLKTRTRTRRNSNFQEKLFSLKLLSRDTDHREIDPQLHNNERTSNQPEDNEEISPEDMYRSIHILQNQNDSTDETIKTNISSRNTSNNTNPEEAFVVLPPMEQCSSSLSSTDTSQAVSITFPDNMESMNENSYSEMSSHDPESIDSTSTSTHRQLNLNNMISSSSQNSKPNELHFEIVEPPRKQKEELKKRQRQKRNKRLTNILSMSPSMRKNYIKKNKRIKTALSNIDPLDNSDSRNLFHRRRTATDPGSNQTKNNNKFWNTNMFDYNEQNDNDEPNDENMGFDEENNFPTTNTMMSANYVSWEPKYGRNSVFTGLTKEQRNELGGVEYRAIKLLCIILLIYYIGWHICCAVMMIPWACLRKHYNTLLKAQHISPVWWAIFTSMSSFCDLGVTLTAESMMPFQNAVYVLIVLMWFIIIGNTGFPILLRFIIWIMFQVSPELSPLRESLGFLLDHPRRCFTLLFPSAATWWLLLTLVALNFTDWILYIILDFNSPPISDLPKGIAVLAGLFQAVCTRTAGFNVVDIAALHPSIQVSYMLMMYVSVLPLAISIRRTNVYEEQSLGIYGSVRDVEDLEEEAEKDVSTDDEDVIQEPNSNCNSTRTSRNNSEKSKANRKKRNSTTAKSFIGAHLRRQLSFDLWYLFLGLFIVCVCESGKIQNPDMPALNVFSILFEIVSAYGTVGLSLGYPGTNTSLSAQFTPISKLVIIAMLVRGRNRGLPYSLDRAIILPTKKLQQIDRMEDLRNKHHHQQHTKNKPETQSHGDAMNNYIKKKYHQFRRDFNTIKKTATMAPIDEDR